MASININLTPIRSLKKAPKGAKSDIDSPISKLASWAFLLNIVKKWSKHLPELTIDHYGDLVSAGECFKVAEELTQNLNKLSKRDRDLFLRDIKLWKSCRGYRLS